MATGSKVGQPHNSNSVISDSKAGQATELPSWKESLGRNISAFPDKVIAYKQVTSKIINLKELPEGQLPSARDLGYTIDEEKRNFIIQFLKDAKPETLEKFFKLAVEEAGAVPAVPFVPIADPSSLSPAPRPADAPPLWAERKSGWNDAADEKASPVLWIKMHYGNKDPDNWDSMGLTRADLQHDQRLYMALAKQYPDFLPKRQYQKYTDADLEGATPGRALRTPEDSEAKRKYDANKQREKRFQKSN